VPASVQATADGAQNASEEPSLGTTNLQLFEAQMAAFGQMDVDRLLASFGENAVLQDMSAPDSPWIGREEIRGFLRDYFSHLSDVRVTIASVATSDDRIFAELEVKARYAANPASSADLHDVQMRYCVVETFSHGEIIHERFYWDRGQFESQLTGQ
jgi:ketosteroid isomerase-like protein